MIETIKLSAWLIGCFFGGLFFMCINAIERKYKGDKYEM